MYVSTEALGVGVPIGFYFDLYSFFFFSSFGEGFVIWASWEGLISAFFLFQFFIPILIHVYYMCLSDSCVTCVPILLLCDLKRLSELLMGWATSVYKHPFNYDIEHIPRNCNRSTLIVLISVLKQLPSHILLLHNYWLLIHLLTLDMGVFVRPMADLAEPHLSHLLGSHMAVLF